MDSKVMDSKVMDSKVMDSKVHRTFVNQPMGNKPVTALPGIGEKLGQNLIAKGYHNADKVFGQFLVLEKDEQQTKSWLMSNAGADTGQQQKCFDGLHEYYTKWMM